MSTSISHNLLRPYKVHGRRKVYTFMDIFVIFSGRRDMNIYCIEMHHTYDCINDPEEMGWYYFDLEVCGPLEEDGSGESFKSYKPSASLMPDWVALLYFQGVINESVNW